MKKSTLILLTCLSAFFMGKAQSKQGTLNLGVGLGYYAYVGNPAGALMANYEMRAAKNITLAPFVAYYSYSKREYWGNKNYPYRYYKYRASAVPVGIKGAYYFDELLKADSDWDFYAAASLGFTFHKVIWEDGYYGDSEGIRMTSPLFIAGHLGARYHVNKKVGVYLDLSSGLSTAGLSIKM